MSSTIGVTSYSIGALAYLLLCAMLFFSWRGRLQGGLLLFAVGGMVVWAAINAWQLAYRSVPMSLIWTLEVAHFLLWLVFLLHLFPPGIRTQAVLRVIRYGGYSAAVVVLLYSWISPFLESHGPGLLLPELPLIGQLTLALLGLVALEQLYLNTRPDMRWYIKFLCLALGGLFIYEFYLYADALLFKHLDFNLWAARGL
ncbi:MAG TPA: PEP-CTERM system histidine kinase PrsK, partial [Chromatiaceae bacterium]|nr:PEP-CTERM system histidine kinase PrsK [Chromatiaceae bacterium]